MGNNRMRGTNVSLLSDLLWAEDRHPRSALICPLGWSVGSEGTPAPRISLLPLWLALGSELISVPTPVSVASLSPAQPSCSALNSAPWTPVSSA